MFCIKDDENITISKQKNLRLRAELKIIKIETGPEGQIEMNLNNLFGLSPDQTGRIERGMSTEGDNNRMKSRQEQEEISIEEIEVKEIEYPIGTEIMETIEGMTETMTDHPEE